MLYFFICAFWSQECLLIHIIVYNSSGSAASLVTMTAALRMLVLMLFTLLHLQYCCTKYLLLDMDTGNKSDHVLRNNNKALTQEDELSM